MATFCENPKRESKALCLAADDISSGTDGIILA